MTPEECGKPLSAIAKGLGVRVYRDGRPYGFWEPEAQSLVAGRLHRRDPADLEDRGGAGADLGATARP